MAADCARDGSVARWQTSDSHHRHRSRPAPHRLGRGRDRSGNSLRFVAAGTVKSDDKAELATRLCQLHDGLVAVIERFAAGRGGGRADLRQQGRGGDAEARSGARHRHAGAGARRAAVGEYAPNAVKKAVIGVGHGEKQQIHMMVKVLMPKASLRQRTRGRRAGHRHLPRASSAERGAAGAAGPDHGYGGCS
jgi:crossover junction endodeoxyribonuclease RuvC